MGRLLLVRHGQASFFGEDYDALSTLGVQQARALGELWLAQGLGAATAFIGPRRRHRETYEAVAAVFAAAGHPFPAPVLLPDLDEHHGAPAIKRHAGQADPYGPDLGMGLTPGADRAEAMRVFAHHYREGMRAWASGALEMAGVEDWRAFRVRSRAVLEHLTTVASHGTCLAFTSGGTICAIAGALLGLDDERVIDLSLALRNTGIAEVRWSADRRSLVSFNDVPHLPDTATHTMI